MEIEPNAKKYIVYVDDNFNFMDESERYKSGEFDTTEEAVAKCIEIVESSIEGSAEIELSASALCISYGMFGEDPFIVGPTEVEFSVSEYVRKRAEEIYPIKPNISSKEIETND